MFEPARFGAARIDFGLRAAVLRAPIPA